MPRWPSGSSPRRSPSIGKGEISFFSCGSRAMCRFVLVIWKILGSRGSGSPTQKRAYRCLSCDSVFMAIGGVTHVRHRYGGTTSGAPRWQRRPCSTYFRSNDVRIPPAVRKLWATTGGQHRVGLTHATPLKRSPSQPLHRLSTCSSLTVDI